MAKKKKRKEENKESSGYIVELKGIALVLISIIGLCPFGIVADFIKGFSCFLFGTLWAIFLVFIGIVGMYTIIKRKIPKILSGKTIGLFIIIIGILALLHVNYINKTDVNPDKFKILDDGFNIVKITIDNVMLYIKGSINASNTGGGVLGALFISIFTALLTLTGAKFISIALISIGILIYTGLSLYDIFKKTGDGVKKVASHVHIEKKDRHKKIVEEPEEEEEVVQAQVVQPIEEENNSVMPKKKYVYPPMSLLNKPQKTDGKENEIAIKNNIPVLEQVLRDFGIEAHVVDTHVGPAVTQYELEIKAGTKVSKILSLNREIALALAAKDVRIQAPIPGKSTIGVELPNKSISMVSVREVLTSVPAAKANSKLLAVLGRDIMGTPQ